MKRLISILLLAGVAACAPAPGKLAEPRSASSLPAGRSLAATADAVWPGDNWWQAYGDPQLDALIAEARTGSPDVAAAMARIRQADALARQAGSVLLPSVSAGGNAGFNKQSYNNGIPAEFVPKGWNDAGALNASASFDLDLWGKNRAALAAATSNAQAAKVDADQALLLLTSNVAGAYADLAQLFAERDIAARALEVRQDTFKLTGQRVDNGLDNRGTLQLSQSRAAAAEADVAALDEAIALTRNRLAALVGSGPDRGLDIVRPQLAALAPRGLPANLPLDLIGRRPDIVSARLRAEAATHTIRSDRAAFYPDINLTALIGVQSLGLGNIVDSGSTYGSVGPAFSLPLLNRGRLVGQLRGAEAASDLAVADYDAALIKALQDVADASASIRALGQRRASAAEALSAAEGAYSIAQQRYTGGLATYLDVLTAEDTVLAARRSAADLDARAVTLDIALVRALGGGFSDRSAASSASPAR
ncbi:MAG: efflux transporter outer membrane subunit [Candidatus Andeanibacterium colombiense]|uniref:Efflux transporter outer membrane subunit n=1 Tax=Candidatus Andeanibacterium colombiense TaxID=3121345 RepID=A0AAJ5X2G7_9SPHN|nr:MAG: efflux transporter outer membrane subunit [Sphingomonadaceae bacterium]